MALHDIGFILDDLSYSWGQGNLVGVLLGLAEDRVGKGNSYFYIAYKF